MSDHADLEALRQGAVHRLRHAWEDIILRYAYDEEGNALEDAACGSRTNSRRGSDIAYIDEDEEGVVDFSDAQWEDALQAAIQSKAPNETCMQDDLTRSLNRSPRSIRDKGRERERISTLQKRASLSPSANRKRRRAESERELSNPSISRYMTPSSKIRPSIVSANHISKLSFPPPRPSPSRRLVQTLSCEGQGVCAKTFCLSCGSLSPMRRQCL